MTTSTLIVRFYPNTACETDRLNGVDDMWSLTGTGYWEDVLWHVRNAVGTYRSP